VLSARRAKQREAKAIGHPPYLFPFACFECRVAFKRPYLGGAWVRKCPQCGGRALGLSRNFKPPSKSDLSQWEKVQFLVQNGFLFQHVADAAYPRNIREAREFVKKYRSYAMPRRVE
jgi:hypothetical protein